MLFIVFLCAYTHLLINRTNAKFGIYHHGNVPDKAFDIAICLICKHVTSTVISVHLLVYGDRGVRLQILQMFTGALKQYLYIHLISVTSTCVYRSFIFNLIGKKYDTSPFLIQLDVCILNVSWTQRSRAMCFILTKFVIRKRQIQ